MRLVVEEAINLVSLSRAGQQIEYLNHCTHDALVNGHTQKLVQVFVNLLTNAIDASEPGQTITIESQCRANQVMIAVTDQGKGIADEHLSKIFEPFFTTKMVGEGTGLGLSLTYNIIQEHGGSISLVGGARKGCRFEVLLPGIDISMLAEA